MIRTSLQVYRTVYWLQLYRGGKRRLGSYSALGYLGNTCYDVMWGTRVISCGEHVLFHEGTTCYDVMRGTRVMTSYVGNTCYFMWGPRVI